MKRIILIGLIVILGIGTLSAQFSMGHKIGLNVTSFSGADDNEYKAGVNVGLMANYRFNKLLAIQPEFLYSLQGSGADLGYDDIAVKYDVHYINIPVLLKVYPCSGLNIHLGPQFSFFVDDKVSVKSGGTEISADGLDNINSFDFALAMGIGYEFNFGLTFDARFNLGLTKIVNDYEDKNRVFMFSVGYKIDL